MVALRHMLTRGNGGFRSPVSVSPAVPVRCLPDDHGRLGARDLDPEQLVANPPDVEEFPAVTSMIEFTPTHHRRLNRAVPKMGRDIGWHGHTHTRTTAAYLAADSELVDPGRRLGAAPYPPQLFRPLGPAPDSEEGRP
jgi:hypothetical protein